VVIRLLMKRILFLLILVLIFSGCKNKNKFAVDGIVKDSKEKIYLPEQAGS
jgi:PBP1b-binding outer membrane lipoprotein LpoB